MGGAEFYPSCSQLNISGSGTGAPTSDELVSFPGAYKDGDPGIYVPAVCVLFNVKSSPSLSFHQIFDGPMSNYSFPGPAVASFVASSSGSNPASGTSPSGSTSTSSSKPTGINSSKSTKCQLQKQNTVALYPRHFSQAMRRLLFKSSF